MSYILDTITKYRLAHQWTEYQLAELSGVPQSTISSWYRKNMTPSIASLEKICKAFGITLSQFFAVDDELIALTPDQRVLLERWNLLSKEQKEALLGLIEKM